MRSMRQAFGSERALERHVHQLLSLLSTPLCSVRVCALLRFSQSATAGVKDADGGGAAGGLCAPK